MSDNTYAWWQAALAGNVQPIDANTPQAGFYEARYKNRQTQEVTRGVIAYWYVDGALRCKNGSGMLSEQIALERWPFVSKRPISKATYDAVRAGQGWPDEHPAAANDRRNSTAAPEDNTIEAFRDRIEDLAREAEALIAAGAAKTQESADRASDLAGQLLAREKATEVRRREEMKPHEDAAKAVDNAWRPLRDKAADCKARLKQLVVTPYLLWLDEQNRKRAATAAASGAPAPAPRKQTAGDGVALRSNPIAVIEDYAKTLAFFANHEQVKELIQRLANASARAGVCPDGCKIDPNKKAA